MNRYPLWKYLLIAVALLLGALYTVPNFFGESPAVQISSAKATVKLGPNIVGQAQDALTQAQAAIDTAETAIDVAEAAVVGRPHDIKGESIVAYVVLKGKRPEGDEAKKIITEGFKEY